MPERFVTDPKVANFIQTYTKIDSDEEWFFIPRWFKKVDDNTFESYNPEELPQHVKDSILKRRNHDEPNQ